MAIRSLGRKAPSGVSVREADLPIDEQFERLKNALYGLTIQHDGESTYEAVVDLVDVEMICRRLDDAPPLRQQVVEELRRVARLYERLASMAEEADQC